MDLLSSLRDVGSLDSQCCCKRDTNSLFAHGQFFDELVFFGIFVLLALIVDSVKDFSNESMSLMFGSL